MFFIIIEKDIVRGVAALFYYMYGVSLFVNPRLSLVHGKLVSSEIHIILVYNQLKA